MNPGGSAEIIRGDTRNLPVDDESVDLIVTSPPYWNQRSYKDAGVTYEEQIGLEESPHDYVDTIAGLVAGEWSRVLRPGGSIFLNLGDKMVSGGSGTTSGLGSTPNIERDGLASYRMDMDRLKGRQDSLEREARRQTKRGAGPSSKSTIDSPDTYREAAESGDLDGVVGDVTGFRPKSLLGLPWRVANRAVDLGMILRAEIVWDKPNAMPESVTDRVRRTHEQIFHFTKSERYYSAVDELREPYSEGTLETYARGGMPKPGAGDPHESFARKRDGFGFDGDPEGWRGNPLGRLPGSVWSIPTEPFTIGKEVREFYELIKHHAAFPTEIPRRTIIGWTPPGYCLECGEPRRPATRRTRNIDWSKEHMPQWEPDQNPGASPGTGLFVGGAGPTDVEILGYVCACAPFDVVERDGAESSGCSYAEAIDESGEYASQDSGGQYGRRPRVKRTENVYRFADWTPAPTRPAVVLDPFGGTGTTAGVARMLGRHGISVDFSNDYCRLAEWRIFRSDHFQKVLARTTEDRQSTFF